MPTHVQKLGNVDVHGNVDGNVDGRCTSVEIDSECLVIFFSVLFHVRGTSSFHRPPSLFQPHLFSHSPPPLLLGCAYIL